VKRILLAATALAMLGGAAYAQSSSNSGSNTSATNLSGSRSSAGSNPNVIGNQIGNVSSSSTSGATSTASTRSSSQANVSSTGSSSATSGSSSARTGSSTATTNVYVPSTGGATGSTSGAQTLNYGGSYTLRNTPEVIAPNVAGGNPCAIGASGGIGLPGFGLTAGATWADKACELRQKAALLYNMGEPALARELMCQDDDKLRAAMRRLGKPCGIDAQAAQPQAPAPAAAVAPAAAAPRRVAAATATARPEWCTRAAPSTEASRDYVRKVCT
jgi:hypothetical protein